MTAATHYEKLIFWKGCLRHLFFLRKESQSSILWMVQYLFWREILQSSSVWLIISAVVYLFPKTVGSNYALFQKCYNYFFRNITAIHTFNSNIYFSDVEICSHNFCQLNFFQHISEHELLLKKLVIEEATFSEQDRLY